MVIVWNCDMSEEDLLLTYVGKLPKQILSSVMSYDSCEWLLHITRFQYYFGNDLGQ